MGKIANLIKERTSIEEGSMIESYMTDDAYRELEEEISELIKDLFPPECDVAIESDAYDRQYIKGWNDYRMICVVNFIKLIKNDTTDK